MRRSVPTATGVLVTIRGERPDWGRGALNGVAVAAPLLLGLATGHPAQGSTLCLGAYLCAFTDHHGSRPRRTLHLAQAAALNAAAYLAGSWASRWTVVAVVLLAAIVFVFGMGAALGSAAARVASMPATAFLLATADTGQARAGAPGATLMLLGGLWFAALTGLTFPRPRARTTLVAAAEPYLLIARRLESLAREDTARLHHAHGATAAALRAAQAKAAALDQAPPGSTAATLRAQLQPLLVRAVEAADLVAALSVALEHSRHPAPTLHHALADVATRYRQVADTVAGSPRSARPPDPAPGAGSGMELLRTHTHSLRVQARSGKAAHYARASSLARLHRTLEALGETADAAKADAAELTVGPRARLSPPPGKTAGRPRPQEAPPVGSPVLRHASRITAVVCAVFLTADLSGIPNGEWAAMAVLRVQRPQYATTLERGLQRMGGNLIGGTGAALLIGTVRQQVALGLALFSVIVLGFALRPLNYGLWVVFGTPVILLIGDLPHPGDWDQAWSRIAMTVFGTLCALIGGYLLWPRWERDHLREREQRLRTASAAYLSAAVGRLSRPSGESSAQQQARTEAEEALTAASAQLADAHREPASPSHSALRLEAGLPALQYLHLHTTALLALAPASCRTRLLWTAADLDTWARTAARILTDDEQPASGHLRELDRLLTEARGRLEELHTLRSIELADGLTGETATRSAIRDGQPVAETLALIAADLADLTTAYQDLPSPAAE